MLQILETHSPDEKFHLLDSFNPHESTWIISNLRSKVELQNHLINQHGFFIEDSVLRVSDFWKKIFLRERPEFRILQDDLLLLETQHWIRANFQPDVLNSKSASALLDVCHQIHEVYFHFEALNVLKDWCEKQEVPPRWWFWLRLANQLMEHFVENRRLISPHWIPSYIKANRISMFWKRNLIIDLGVDLKPSEAEIFSELALEQRVTVVAPNQTEKPRLAASLRSYDFFRFKNHERLTSPQSDLVKTKSQFYELNSALLECQFAADQIRKWILEDKTPPEQIMIVVPEVEVYWSKLKYFLETEGIPCQKMDVATIMSLPKIQSWLARVFLRLGSLNQAEAKNVFFDQEHASLSFVDFERNFSQVYETEDFQKIPQLKVSKAIIEISFDDLVKVFRSCWKDDDESLLVSFISRIENQIDPRIAFSIHDWKTAIYKYAAKIEIPLDQEKIGIQISSLSSSDTFVCTKRIFLGLNEENIKRSSKSIIPLEDVLQIKNELGFFFEHPDHSPLEFELYWQFLSRSTVDIFCFSKSNFQGQLQGPSTFFIEKCFKDGRLQFNHFDLQNARLHSRSLKINQQSATRSRAIFRLKEDESPSVTIQNVPRPVELSATHLENYGRCPFIYFSQKVLKLQDLPELDFDMDPLTEGQMIHALFEKALERISEPMTDHDIMTMIDEYLANAKFHILDDDLWKNYLNKIRRLIQNFLQFERNWRKEFSNHQIHDLEKTFDFSLLLSGIETKLKGQIDRIETDGKGNYVLVDYKRSIGKFKSHTSWMKDNTIQLLFYAWIMKKFFLSDKDQIVGAFYYDYQKLIRDKGFLNPEYTQNFLPAFEKKRNKVDGSAFEEMMKTFEEHLTNIVQKIAEGEFSTLPLTLDECQRCGWKKLCRAPHLQ